MLTIMVNNIPKSALESDIMRLFMFYGKVERVILVDEPASKFALVHMIIEDEAMIAIRATNGYPLREKRLKVEAYYS